LHPRFSQMGTSPETTACFIFLSSNFALQVVQR
jgi:hypothetical protein